MQHAVRRDTTQRWQCHPPLLALTEAERGDTAALVAAGVVRQWRAWAPPWTPSRVLSCTRRGVGAAWQRLCGWPCTGVSRAPPLQRCVTQCSAHVAAQQDATLRQGATLCNAAQHTCCITTGGNTRNTAQRSAVCQDATLRRCATQHSARSVTGHNTHNAAQHSAVHSATGSSAAQRPHTSRQDARNAVQHSVAHTSLPDDAQRCAAHVSLPGRTTQRSARIAARQEVTHTSAQYSARVASRQDSTRHIVTGHNTEGFSNAVQRTRHTVTGPNAHIAAHCSAAQHRAQRSAAHVSQQDRTTLIAAQRSVAHTSQPDRTQRTQCCTPRCSTCVT